MPRFKFKGLTSRAKRGKQHVPGKIPRDASNYPSNLKALIDAIDLVPSAGQMTISLRVKSQSNVGTSRDEKRRVVSQSGFYFVKLMMRDLQMSEEPVEGWLEVKYRRGVMYVEPLKLDKMQLYMNCSCPDFRHVGEWAIHDQGLLIGRRRRYERKTLPPEHPEVGGNRFSQTSIRYRGRGPKNTVDYDGKGALDDEVKNRTSRPHVNPRMTPVYCKHVYNAVAYLLRQEFMEGTIDK